MDQAPNNNSMPKSPIPSVAGPGIAKIVVIVVAGLVVIGVGYGAMQWMKRAAMDRLSSAEIGRIGANIAANAMKGATDVAAVVPGAGGDEPSQPSKKGYADAEEATIIGDVPAVLKDVIRPAVESAFGGTKMTEFGNMGGTDSEGAFTASFSVPRTVSASDFTAIANKIKAQGYALVSSKADKGSGDMMLQKEKAVITFSYSESDPQTVSVFCIQGK